MSKSLALLWRYWHTPLLDHDIMMWKLEIEMLELLATQAEEEVNIRLRIIEADKMFSRAADARVLKQYIADGTIRASDTDIHRLDTDGDPLRALELLENTVTARRVGREVAESYVASAEREMTRLHTEHERLATERVALVAARQGVFFKLLRYLHLAH